MFDGVECVAIERDAATALLTVSIGVGDDAVIVASLALGSRVQGGA